MNGDASPFGDLYRDADFSNGGPADDVSDFDEDDEDHHVDDEDHHVDDDEPQDPPRQQRRTARRAMKDLFRDPDPVYD